MRRTALFGVLLFLISLVMTGCQAGSGDTTHQDTGGEWQEFAGFIKPLGVSIYPEGTHRLERNDTLIVIIQSTRFNLSQFEEFEVTVAGNVRDMGTGSQKIMDVEQMTILTEADEESQKTKMFVSRYNTYSFRYPQTWPKHEELPGMLSFRGEDKEQSLFSLFVIEEGENFSDWLNKLSFSGFRFDVETLMRVDTKNATRRIYRNEDEQIISVSLPHEGKIYHLLFDSRGSDDLQKDKAALYDLIDGFTFSPLERVSTYTDSVSTTIPESLESDDETDPAEIALDNESDVSVASVSGEEESDNNYVDMPSGVAAEALEKGFTTFTSSSLKFSIDIPKVWYYSGFSGVTGAIYRYGFTDYKTYRESGDDIHLGNLIAMLDIVSGSLDDAKQGEKSTIGGHTVYVAKSGGSVHIYLKRDDSTTFVMKGASVLQPVLEKMVASIKIQ